MDRLFRTPQSHIAAENYPENQVVLADDAVVDIVEAEQVSDYKLRLSFSDGTQRVVDFEPFLRASRNPMIRAYLEPNRVCKFQGRIRRAGMGRLWALLPDSRPLRESNLSL